jgi:two-component system chemotaxis response regulator CheB
MIRCLVVDDSQTMRQLLKAYLNSPDIKVVAEAADANEALEQAIKVRPDVITMDIHMPGEDGFSAIETIMSHAPAPIVVVSSLTDDESLKVGFRALQAGAVEVLPKPGGTGAELQKQIRDLRTSVLAMKGVKVISRKPQKDRRKLTALPFAALPHRVCSIGLVASTGGPVALRAILSVLPKDFPIPILVVQHIVDSFCSGAVAWLNNECELTVKMAAHGDLLEGGNVYFAGPGRHLLVRAGRVHLRADAPIYGHLPSGNALLSSLARECGRDAAGVILTGMGDDGVEGLLEMRKAGAYTAAQGPQSSLIFGMPKEAQNRGAAEVMLELPDIPRALLQFAQAVRTTGVADPAPEL